MATTTEWLDDIYRQVKTLEESAREREQQIAKLTSFIDDILRIDDFMPSERENMNDRSVNDLNAELKELEREHPTIPDTVMRKQFVALYHTIQDYITFRKENKEE